MAIVTKNPSGLKLRFDCGKDDITGKVKVKSKTYSHLKPAATAEDVFAVANAIASVQEYSILEVAKIDNSTLSE
ncbi:MAG: DUF1659 domain-containing protein [Cellulosilyticaceae bacterium]